MSCMYTYECQLDRVVVEWFEVFENECEQYGILVQYSTVRKVEGEHM